MQTFKIILGNIIFVLAGIELLKAGDERNWVKLCEALVIGILALILIK